MGYSIKIGEGLVVVSEVNSSMGADVVLEKHNEAPTFGEVTDYENRILPSYGGWDGFIEFCGLQDLFWNSETSLMRDNESQYGLDHTHLLAVEDAIKRLYEKYPCVLAQLAPQSTDDGQVTLVDNWPKENECLARLIWLKYWMGWALKNCKKPVFQSS